MSQEAKGCLSMLMVLVLSAVIFVVFLHISTRYIVPLLPRRIIPNPAGQEGVGRYVRFLNLLPLTGGGRPVMRAELIGRVVLVNFWGTWCPPCRAELPHIAELGKRFDGHKDFQLLAISYPSVEQEDDLPSLREETADLLKKLRLDLPTYYDPRSASLASLNRVFTVEGFPTTILLDRRGMIRAVWSGYRPGVETEMERLVSAVLAEPMTSRGAPLEDY